MSSKFKVLNIALVAALALGIFALPAKADVTGNFGIHVFFVPDPEAQTPGGEISPLLIDFANELNVTYVVSGLSSTFHTHFGVAGVEDVIVGTSATLGALDLGSTVVFGRFGCLNTPGSGLCRPNVDPFYDELHFIKKIVTASISLGGVTFSNLAVIEDVNAFVSQTTAYAMGDIFTISGQTPSGVGLVFETGICMEATPNLIKKHRLLEFSVNPHCATEPKPDILFDFENVWITGVPLAPGVTANGHITCALTDPCGLALDFKFSTPSVPIPFTSTFTFVDITSLAFSGATLRFSAGAGTLIVDIDNTGTIAATQVIIEAVLNPDTNAAILIVDAAIIPGNGLDSAVVGLIVPRFGFVMSALVLFVGGPPAEFAFIQFGVEVPGGLVNFEAKTKFFPGTLLEGEFWMTIDF